MAAHMARTDRTHQLGAIVIAVGVGLLAFAFLDGGKADRDGTSPPGRTPGSSPPTVLGEVVTTTEVPLAGAATPATFLLDDVDGEATPGPTTTAGPTLIPPTSIENTTTTGPPVLIPPTSIVNTTTTTTSAPTTTTEPTTTTTTTTDPTAP